MPPTPQQHQPSSSQQIYAQMAPQPSPQNSQQQSSSQPNGLVSSFSAHNNYNVSFDGSQQSLSQPNPTGYAQSFPNGPVSNPGFARSFGDNSNLHPMRQYTEQSQIYTAAYSGVSVYEMEVSGVACMRRRSDGWLNATQILKVAGVDKGKRTKVLEKEILTGEHEKVQGGYGKYQGTWISYRRGREFCRQYGVEEILRPLLEYDVAADGSSGQSQQETPTKEQAMAAQRKKFYNSSVDQRPNGVPNTNGTFFQNISSTTSMALAAMNKAARLNSPAPRTGSTPRPTSTRKSSQQDLGGSQQSMISDAEGKAIDSGYNTQQNGEPPRKRMRPDSREEMSRPNLPLDVSMHSITPTEPSESFLYENALMADSVNAAGEPIALPPLPSPATEEQQEKMNLILDLFAEQSRTDYASHRALQELSNEDLNMPLDASANNALHWAATLAKVPLLKLLIQRGASIWRGNAAGQSPLVSAVLVSNCWEHSCFPEVLDLLGPLIEVRDLQGRTILHHISVSSGIKGRAPSSKYYLEALLEFLIRVGSQPNTSTAVAGLQAAAVNTQGPSQRSNGDVANQELTAPSLTQPRGPVSLLRFLSHILNARDKAGNTALNLVARIGNRSIIQQLLEIQADPSLPNNKGVSAKDFGVGLEPSERSYGNGLASQRPTQSQNHMPAVQSTPDEPSGPGINGSQTEDLGQDVIASMTSMLTQNLASHKELLHSRSEQIDKLNEQIRELSAQKKAGHDEVQELKDRVRLRSERLAKIANLKREIERRKADARKLQGRKAGAMSPQTDVRPQWLCSADQVLSNLEINAGQPSPEQQQFLTQYLPSTQTMETLRNAYAANNGTLERYAGDLHAKSTKLEEMYRKVVSLCTGVPEDKVEESLPALVAAVESEKGGIGEQEVGRVREFLRRVENDRGSAPGEVQQPQLTGLELIVNPTVTAAAEHVVAERAAAAARAARV